MASNSKTGWLVPTGLLLLCAVPVLAGMVRLVILTIGEPSLEDARFFDAPLPVVLHILSASLYAVLGIFQFLPNFRRTHKAWHRLSGRILIVAGLTVALSGLWMTQTYPWPPFETDILHVSRIVAGAAMFLFISLGVKAIARRDIPMHRAWMIRAYAVAMGAGTQVFTHIPWAIWPELQTDTMRWILMDAGWIINLLIAEYIVHKPRRRAVLQGATS